jgi:hypothetical protein
MTVKLSPEVDMLASIDKDSDKAFPWLVWKNIPGAALPQDIFAAPKKFKHCTLPGAQRWTRSERLEQAGFHRNGSLISHRAFYFVKVVIGFN